jgi:hypothetical protein
MTGKTKNSKHVADWTPENTSKRISSKLHSATIHKHQID